MRIFIISRGHGVIMSPEPGLGIRRYNEIKGYIDQKDLVMKDNPETSGFLW